MPRDLTPEGAQEWLSVVIRYLVCPLLGVALLLHEAWTTDGTRVWVISAGVTLLGYPVADFVDVVRRNGNGK